MVGAGRGHGHGPLGRFLSFDVGIVEPIVAESAARRLPLERGRRNVELFGVKADSLGQGPNGDHIQAVDNRGFLRVLGRNDESARSLLSSGQSHGENALRRAERSIEGEFAGGTVSTKQRRGELSAGTEQAECDRQIERGRLFRQVGRRERNDDAIDGPRVAAVNEGPFDAVHALFDGGFGKADEDRLGHGPGRDVDLDLHGLRVDSEQRISNQLGKHRRRRRDLSTSNW